MRLLFLLSLISLIYSYPSYSNTKYPFTLKVLSEDQQIADTIINKINQRIVRFENLEIDNDESYNNGVSVTLIIYAHKHINSNFNKDHISLTIAHTSKFKFLNLMGEVFKDGSEYNDDLKGMVADLLINNRAILKRLNAASIDNISEVDKVIETILINLSDRMEGYHKFESVR